MTSFTDLDTALVGAAVVASTPILMSSVHLLVEIVRAKIRAPGIVPLTENVYELIIAEVAISLRVCKAIGSRRQPYEMPPL